MQRLNDKQQQFCREYLIDFNGTQAAIRAGYNPSTAGRYANQLLNLSHVKAEIDRLKDARAERTDRDGDSVIEWLHDVKDMDVSDILDDDGKVLPVKQWPKIWRTALNAMDVIELMQGRDDDRKVASVLRKIKWPDKVRVAELLGKHYGKFNESVDHKHKFIGPDGQPVGMKVNVHFVAPGEKA